MKVIVDMPAVLEGRIRVNDDVEIRRETGELPWCGTVTEILERREGDRRENIDRRDGGDRRDDSSRRRYGNSRRRGGL